MKKSTKMKVLMAGLMAVLVHVTPANAATAMHAKASSSMRESASTRLYTGLGLGSSYGVYGMPLNFGARFRVQKSSNFWVGGDTGISIGMGYSIPLLASVTYELGEKGRKTRTYFGASLGPVIAIAAYPYAGLGLGLRGNSFNGLGGLGSAATVHLGMLLRPGLALSVSRSVDINFEAPFGVVGGAFYMAPQANVQFNL